MGRALKEARARIGTKYLTPYLPCLACVCACVSARVGELGSSQDPVATSYIVTHRKDALVKVRAVVEKEVC